MSFINNDISFTDITYLFFFIYLFFTSTTTTNSSVEFWTWLDRYTTVEARSFKLPANVVSNHSVEAEHAEWYVGATLWQIDCNINIEVHRCGPGVSMRACHAADPGSIPDRDKFPGWVFFRGFSSPVRQMSGSFRSQGLRILFGHHYHQSSFITGANDLRCWRALKPPIYIYILTDISTIRI